MIYCLYKLLTKSINNVIILLSILVKFKKQKEVNYEKNHCCYIYDTGSNNTVGEHYAGFSRKCDRLG